MNKFNIENLKKPDQIDFKPKIKNNNEKKEDLTAEMGANALMLNDNTYNYKSFDIQWKTLVKMNDDQTFCDNVKQIIFKNHSSN